MQRLDNKHIHFIDDTDDSCDYLEDNDHLNDAYNDHCCWDFRYNGDPNYCACKASEEDRRNCLGKWGSMFIENVSLYFRELPFVIRNKKANIHYYLFGYMHCGECDHEDKRRNFKEDTNGFQRCPKCKQVQLPF